MISSEGSRRTSGAPQHPPLRESARMAAGASSGERVQRRCLTNSGSPFVIFRRPARGEDHLISMTRAGAEAAPPHPAPRITIRSAFYEPANGQPGGADVTAKVAALVAAGDTSIAASNELFGDPTPN